MKHDPITAGSSREEPRYRCESLVAISDLHVEVPENKEYVEALQPRHRGDWLIVCGDVGDTVADIEWTLGMLAERFEKVIWTPGNHDLWTCAGDPLQLRGDARYRHLVRRCRDLGIVTPEDDYPVWPGPGGPAIIASLFTLYDYSFSAGIAPSARDALERAHTAGVVCSDELVLYPHPYTSREAWCRHRVSVTERRLVEIAACGLKSVLVNHFPLRAELTTPLYHREFALWCGTTLTADWHTRFGAVAVVYGHLHIPRTTTHDGVRFHEVSLGYPRQWRYRSNIRLLPRPILSWTI